MSKILVTGGAGFIGGHLVDRLLKQGNEVVVVDHIGKQKGGLGYVPPGVKLIMDDITNPLLYPMLDKYQFDGVYHLAAQTCGEDSFNNPQEDIRTNQYGTFLVSDYCRSREIGRLIFTSTNAVYGFTGEEIVDEESPKEPASVYGVTKLAGEHFLKQRLKDSKTDYTIFRLTNIYGPGENLNYQKKGLVSILASFLWKKEPVRFRGSTERFRDILYVDDAVEALTKSFDERNTFNETYILSSGEKTYFHDLLKKIIFHAGEGEDYPVTYEEGTPGDMFGFHADISKIKRDLKWEPRHNLDQGLEKFFEWINQVPVTDNLAPFHPFLLKE